MKNILSYEVDVKTHFSMILHQFQLNLVTLLAPNSVQNRIKNQYVNDDAFSSFLERLTAPPRAKKRGKKIRRPHTGEKTFLDM